MLVLALPGGLEDSFPNVCMSDAITNQSVAFFMPTPNPEKQWSTQPFNLCSHPCHTATKVLPFITYINNPAVIVSLFSNPSIIYKEYLT